MILEAACLIDAELDIFSLIVLIIFTELFVSDMALAGFSEYLFSFTMNVNGSNERKWFPTKKGQKIWRYSVEIIMDANHADDLMLLAITSEKAEFLLQSL